MTGGLRKQVSDSARSFRAVFQNADLRRVELAWAGSITAEWAYGVALAVYAYDVGGAAAVGLISLVRLLPAAIAAPFLAVLADRFPRERVMFLSHAVRGTAMAGAAVAVLADGPAALVYTLAVLVGLAAKAFRPAQAAALPSLARTPDELTAANVASSAIESVGSFAGPAIGGLALIVGSPGLVFAAAALTFFASAGLIARVSAEPRKKEARPEQQRIARMVFAGFGAIASDRDLRLLVALYSSQTLVAGALNVLVVVASIELLGLGESGVGYLNSALGIGGLLGAVVALGLVGRQRLAFDFGSGLVLWGVAQALLGVWPEAALALVLLGLVGIANTLVDVAGLTLLQRSVADEVLARVFGALESLLVGTLALGAVLAPVLSSLVGIRLTFVLTGMLLPVLALLFWRRLAAMDARTRAPERELALLRELPLFAPLPGPTLEHLAAHLVPVRISAGEEVFRQGESGDRFYVVGSGTVKVVVDGRPAPQLGPGDHFGEIALLRDMPRTATVSAETDAELYVLDRAEFISAVTGHPESAAAADAVITARLAPIRAGLGSV